MDSSFLNDIITITQQHHSCPSDVVMSNKLFKSWFLKLLNNHKVDWIV